METKEPHLYKIKNNFVSSKTDVFHDNGFGWAVGFFAEW
jgi:hypothetical protein